MRYVSLHTHSTFSYGDGFGPVEDHVKRVFELGMKSLALTEHGNASSHVQLETYAKKYGIKPIYGIEAYTAPPGQQPKFHQTILAMNETGYRNLNRMVSESWVKHDDKSGSYYYPTIHSWQLEKYNEGLIVTSGCADSLLSCTLLGGKSLGDKRESYTQAQYDKAVSVVRWYRKIFGDRYYLEVQRFPGLRRSCILNPAFEQIARDTGARLVATADVHYPLPGDNKMQTILHAAHRGSTVEATEASWEYDILLTYPTSDAEIYRDLVGTGLSTRAAKQAVLETERIAARCNVELPKNEPIKWPYDQNKFGSIEEYTWHRLREGWKYRWKMNPHLRERMQEYADRIAYEMERIVPRGFCDYFGMLSYLVTWAKDREIPVGPARGSSAASLVCYLLRITEVDPMQFPTMVFERFIDPKRLDLPDVDLDFADDRRDEVRQEAIRVFGEDRVGNIANFTRYRGKNSIDDIARVYNIPGWETKKIKDLIIERSGGDSRISDSLQDTFDMFPAAQAVVDAHPELGLATRLEGNYRGLGVHAAGLVISNAPITDTCAVYNRMSGGRIIQVVAYDKKDAEKIGMLKADFLGLKTMGAIGIALRATGVKLDELYSVPLTDKAVLRAFKTNDVTGIFQFEGRATRLVCRDVSPDNFMHLADINALSRPGPLFSGMTAAYTEVKHGRKEAEKLHPIVDEFTKHSYGQIVYQEQVLGVIRDLGGFPVQRVGDIRKIISQKLGEASFNEMYQEFERGAYNIHGVDPKLAKHIWKFLVTSATYSFNIAHCVTSDTIVERPRAADNLTIGQIWRALNKFEHGANGGPDAAMGISFAGPCMACGVRSKFYRQKQCSKCHNIRLAHKLGRLKGLSIGDDGLIRPNKIEKVFNNGVQDIHLVTLEDGASMRVTGDHSWMNSSGGWTATDELKVGDDLLWFRRYSKDLNDQEKCGPNYWKLKRRDKSKDVCSICSVARPNLDISHKDGLHSNDRPGNLWILCRSCHTKYDRDNNGRTLGPWTIGKEPSFNRVAKIERDIGREEVFTLQMSGDVNHNYITGNGAINKNCISYSMLAFWLQWLKQNEPVAFYAAQLEKVGDGKDQEVKRARLMRDAINHGVRIKPPSFSVSGASWSADLSDGSVRAGFTQIKGIGPKTYEAIKETQEAMKDINGVGFQNWEDLINVKGIGPKTIEKIVDFAGVDDPFGLETTGKVLDELRDAMKYGMSGLPRPTHRSHEIPERGEHEIVWMGMVRSREYKDYIEDQRARTGDDLDEIRARMKDPHLVKSCVLHCYDDGEDEVYVRINRWAFPKFKEKIESLEMDNDIIIVTGKKREDFGISLHVKDMVILEINTDEKDDPIEDDEIEEVA